MFAIFCFEIFNVENIRTAVELEQSCDFSTIPRENTNKTLTYEEELALERDAKRRRVKHKSVHTSKKNYTEVIREVIDGQMDMYKEWLEAGVSRPKELDEKKLPDLDETKSKSDKVRDDRSESGYAQSTTSRNSAHSGRSRSRSRKRDYEYSRPDYRRDRDRKYDYKRDKYEHKHDEHHYRSYHRNSYRDRSDRDKSRENHRLSRHRHS